MMKGLHICRALLPEVDLVADAERLRALDALAGDWSKMSLGLTVHHVWLPTARKAEVLAYRHQRHVDHIESLQKQMVLVEHSAGMALLMGYK